MLDVTGKDDFHLCYGKFLECVHNVMHTHTRRGAEEAAAFPPVWKILVSFVQFLEKDNTGKATV